MKLKSLSIVLPCYNEEKNIRFMVDKCLDVGHKITDDLEIIIVNDGSKDRTRLVALELKELHKEVRLISQRNKGYGGAVKRGLDNAKKDWIFFTDSDLQFDVFELEKFIPFTEKYNFIFGFRLKRAEGFKRLLLARMLKVWNKIFLKFPLRYRDIDCAFKLMRKESYKSIGEIKSTGAMFTTEMILRIKRKKYKIKQLGVNHYERQFGKSTGSNFGVILKAVRETFMLRKLLND